MTREEAKEFYPILQAYAEGKAIETRRKPTIENNGVTKDGWSEFNDWTEMKELEYWVNVEYRIKSEPTYRPFNDAEECWQEMQKHQPFGWLKDMENNRRIVITAVEDEIDYEGRMRINSNPNWDLIFDSFTFADGAPFGVKGEEE